jgi:hypothetical protein
MLVARQLRSCGRSDPCPMVRRRLGERQPQPGGLVHLDRPRHRDLCSRLPTRYDPLGAGRDGPGVARAGHGDGPRRGAHGCGGAGRPGACCARRRCARSWSTRGSSPMHDIRCCKGRLFYVVRGQTRDGVEVYGMTEEQTLGFATICRAQPLRASPVEREVQTIDRPHILRLLISQSRPAAAPLLLKGRTLPGGQLTPSLRDAGLLVLRSTTSPVVGRERRNTSPRSPSLTQAPSGIRMWKWRLWRSAESNR